MKFAVLFLAIATLSAAGCSGYRPSEATCFSFVSRGPLDAGCTFTPLGGASLAFGPVSESAPADARDD